MKYFINGWCEAKSYFLSFGFTESELERMKNGEVVHKGNNDFWIEMG